MIDSNEFEVSDFGFDEIEIEDLAKEYNILPDEARYCLTYVQYHDKTMAAIAYGASKQSAEKTGQRLFVNARLQRCIRGLAKQVLLNDIVPSAILILDSIQRSDKATDTVKASAAKTLLSVAQRQEEIEIQRQQLELQRQTGDISKLSLQELNQAEIDLRQKLGR